MPAGEKLTLSYARTPRRRARRRVIVVALVLTLCAAGWRSGPAGWRHARLLVCQHRCFGYAPPPDQVVYDGGGDRSYAPDMAVAGRPYAVLTDNGPSSRRGE